MLNFLALYQTGFVAYCLVTVEIFDANQNQIFFLLSWLIQASLTMVDKLAVTFTIIFKDLHNLLANTWLHQAAK